MEIIYLILLVIQLARQIGMNWQNKCWQISFSELQALEENWGTNYYYKAISAATISYQSEQSL